MTTLTSQSTQLITNYIVTLDGLPKIKEVIDRFVADPILQQHILQTEAAFPSYRIQVRQMIAQDETVALRGTFSGVHSGPFAGIAPTGKHVVADLMIFYRISGNRIVEHWMQLDVATLLAQLTSPPEASAHA